AVVDHLYYDVDDSESGRADPHRRFGQQGDTGRGFPPRVGRPELGTEITQRTRGEKGVAGGVRGDVAVGVAADPGLPRPFQTCEEKSTARHERVDVGTDAHPWHFQHECSCSSWLMSVREDFVE